MTESKAIELMQCELDGEISVEEREALAAALAKDPSLRATRSELAFVQGALEGMPVVAPPGGMKDEIMRQAREAAAGSHVLDGRGRFEARRRKMRFGIRLAYGIAAAAVLALVFVPAMFDDVSRHELAGTMANPSVTEIRTTGVEGSIETRRFDGGASALVTITTPGPWTVIGRFDPARVAVRSVTREGRAVNRAVSAEGEVRLDGVGPYTFTMTFDALGTRDAETVTVRVLGAGGDRSDAIVKIR